MQPNVISNENLQMLVASILKTRDPQLLVSRVPSFKSQRFKKGEVLLRQGAIWGRVYFVQHGIIRTHITDREGADFNNSFYSEGMMLLPLTPELEARPSLFNISTVEPSAVWHVPITEFRERLSAQALWEPLRVELLGRLLSRKLQREFDLLTLDGRARYEKFCQAQPELAKRLPLIHIASYLGLTNVSLSRFRRQLKMTK